MKSLSSVGLSECQLSIKTTYDMPQFSFLDQTSRQPYYAILEGISVPSLWSIKSVQSEPSEKRLDRTPNILTCRRKQRKIRTRSSGLNLDILIILAKEFNRFNQCLPDQEKCTKNRIRQSFQQASIRTLRGLFSQS